MADQSLMDIAREFLEAVSSELDPHTTRQGIVKQEGENKMILLTPSHIQFAKYGRAPGKQPPVDEIKAWVKRKGIVQGEDEIEGTAWAIAKSIAKKGTVGYKRNAPNAMDEAITTHIDSYNKKIAGMVSVEVEDKLLEEYKKLFPEKIEFKI